jgi:hypothetical protein
MQQRRQGTMTARTQLTSGYILASAGDTFNTVPSAGLAPGAGGMYIAGGTGATEQDFRKMQIFCVIGSTATVVTLRASSNGNNVAGTAQTSPYPSSTVFVGGTSGDLVSASTTSATLVLGPLTTDRFLQPDGNIYLDFSQTTGVTVYAVQRPFVIV